MTLTTGALPVVVAWLTKLVLDGVVGSAPLIILVWLGLGLAVAGVLARVTPQLIQFLRSELERQVALLATDRLFVALEGFVGLARFEDPHFLDRLRLAQQASMRTVQQAVDGMLGVGRAVITVGGFAASLWVISPVMTAVVLASGAPGLLARRSRFLGAKRTCSGKSSPPSAASSSMRSCCPA
ncbi:6TM ABC transporter family protein [Fodinicola feengrottensis]|uniref:hypothetical protein n=1 Tax=Fodinicola feengrottensis TaxID=435914 RepID=UPI0024424D00|nr:hypothetical protein [Fodinicola feengrottensis]